MRQKADYAAVFLCFLKAATIKNNVLNNLHNNQSQKQLFIKSSILRVNAIQLDRWNNRMCSFQQFDIWLIHHTLPSVVNKVWLALCFWALVSCRVYMIGHYETGCCLRTTNMYANIAIFYKEVKIYKSKFMKSSRLYQNRFWLTCSFFLNSSCYLKHSCHHDIINRPKQLDTFARIPIKQAAISVFVECAL